MNANDSAWRDDARWQARLASDERSLGAALTADDREVVDGMVEGADSQGALDFLVVYGSVARGERREESDLDIYFEASDLPEPFNRTDPARRWHVYGLPSGALLDNLRNGRRFAFDLADEALIVIDRGPYRDVLIAADEESLAPTPAE